MSVSVLVPYAAGGCPWRARAWDYVSSHYATNHPDWEVITGTCAGEWSKGAAVADALSRASGDTLVIADADSWVGADTMRRAVASDAAWVVPHGRVYRLTQRATETVYAGGIIHRGSTVRRPYIGPAGGGIVVLSRKAFERVGGIDPRYLGWGGEDISFGWALEAIVGPYVRLGGPLQHLYHPHPAPTLRGTPESEALVAQYKAARHSPERMAALIERRLEETPHG